MKTLGLLRAVVLVAMVFVGIAGTQLNAQDKFVTNEIKTGDLVTGKIVYRVDGSLYRHMKYDYAYNDEGRMISKETFKWNGAEEVWIPYCKTTYQYSGKEIIMEYARWNEDTRAYDASKEKSVYEWNEANLPTACTRYEWNAVKNDWKQSVTYLYDDFLLALTR